MQRKKVISMILALVMAFAFGISALAEEGNQKYIEMVQKTLVGLD